MSGGALPAPPPPGLTPGFQLGRGAHPHGPSSGACLMELVSRVAGESWTDRPMCVSPVLAEFGRRLNDALPDDIRQELVPLAPRLVSTADDGLDERRCYLTLDWVVRTWLPGQLRRDPALTDLADELAAAGELTGPDSAAWFRPLLREAIRAFENSAAKTNAAWVATHVYAASVAGYYEHPERGVERVQEMTAVLSGFCGGAPPDALARSAVQLFTTLIAPGTRERGAAA